MHVSDPYERNDRTGWWYRYTHPLTGKRVQKRGGDTARDCWEAALRCRRRFEMLEDGLVSAADLTASDTRRRPLVELIADYQAVLTGRQLSATYIQNTISAIKRTVGLEAGKGAAARPCRWQCLDDVEPLDFERYLSDLIAVGVSPRTRNDYRAAMVGFVEWLTVRRAIPANPLKSVPTLPAHRTPARPGRALTPDEFWRLVHTAEAQPKGGKRRALIYRLRGRAGVRGSEIRRLQKRHLHLEESPPYLHLTADITKNGRDADVVLDDDLAALLQAHADKVPGRWLFKERVMLLTFKRDLRKAGITYRTAEGQADMKSLRRMYNIHMTQAGVDLSVRMVRMRHSDPKLTETVYQGVSRDQQAQGLEALRYPGTTGVAPGAAGLHLMETLGDINLTSITPVSAGSEQT